VVKYEGKIHPTIAGIYPFTEGKWMLITLKKIKRTGHGSVHL
jgi:hypothetical protein